MPGAHPKPGRSALLLGGLFFLALGCFWIWLEGPAAAPPQKSMPLSAPPSTRQESMLQAAPPQGRPVQPVSPPTQNWDSTEAILAEIEDAATSYDAAELPRIRPFLSHADPAVREAALQGIIILGEAEGAALLRDAARVAPTPREAAHLLEMADYLELPSASLLKPGAAQQRATQASPPAEKPPGGE